MTNYRDYTNPSNYRKEIKEKEMELELLKEHKATTINEILKVKEKATRSQHINEKYHGHFLGNSRATRKGTE